MAKPKPFNMPAIELRVALRASEREAQKQNLGKAADRVRDLRILVDEIVEDDDWETTQFKITPITKRIHWEAL
jgi:hypothetical protein